MACAGGDCACPECGMSDLPGLGGLTGALSGPLSGGTGAPGSVARNFSSPLSQSIFGNSVRNSQINNLQSLGGAGVPLRGAIQRAGGIPRPGANFTPRERPGVQSGLMDVARTGALRQIGDPSFRLGQGALDQLLAQQGQQGQPPPAPPVGGGGRDPRTAGFFNLPQQPIPGLNQTFGPGGRLSQTLQRPQPQQPTVADQTRSAFLGQNPLGNRLRQGLGANFQGQNLFGGANSRLGQVLQRPQPQNRGNLFFDNPPPGQLPPLTADRARELFLSQSPTGQGLRDTLGRSFRGEPQPQPQVPQQPLGSVPFTPEQAAQQGRDAFLEQTPGGLGERLRRGLAANFQGRNDGTFLGGPVRHQQPQQIPRITGEGFGGVTAQGGRDFLTGQNPLGDLLRNRLGNAFQQGVGGQPQNRGIQGGNAQEQLIKLISKLRSEGRLEGLGNVFGGFGGGFGP